MSVSLEPADGKTSLTLRHSNVPDDDMGRQHQDGWSFVIDAIAARCAKK